MISSLGTQGGRRYTQMRSFRGMVQKLRSIGAAAIAVVESIWSRRGNVDGGGWSIRRITSAPAIVGSGSNGFTVLSVFMDGVIFWKPRNVRFGEIYSGNDEWVKRAKGSDIWNKRAIG